MTARKATTLPIVQISPALNGCPKLDPEKLDVLAEAAINALMAEGESTNTLRSYRTVLRYWAAWYSLRYKVNISMPVPVQVVLQFIVDHATRVTDAGLVCELPAECEKLLIEGGFKAGPGALALSTLNHRLSVLSKAHEVTKGENPCRDAAVRELMAKTRRAYSLRGTRPNKKEALTKDPLAQILATCDESLRGVRDRALLQFAWSTGGRRRSEVTSACFEDLKKTGPDEYTFTLRRSKTNQSGADRDTNIKPLKGSAAAAMDAWLEASQITSGPLFRKISRHDKVEHGLSPAAVRTIVMARCKLADLDGDYSAHSLRSGFVTEAGKKGMPMGDVMSMSDHASVASLVGYYRTGEASNNPAAALFDK